MAWGRAENRSSVRIGWCPQVDVRDFGYAGSRQDFSDERKARLKEAIGRACRETRAASVTVHVGQDAPDLRQLSYLPEEDGERMRVVRHDVPGHALGAGLKQAGLLKSTVLRDLLGHTYMLPPAARAP